MSRDSLLFGVGILTGVVCYVAGMLIGHRYNIYTKSMKNFDNELITPDDDQVAGRLKK